MSDTRLDVLTIGNAIVDVIADATDDFLAEEGLVKAVDGVSYDVQEGETLALVGESGCGKSISALSLLKLIPIPPGRIVSGEVLFEGEDLMKLSENEIRKIRGNRISMVVQEPMTSLNPAYTIGRQISESLIRHRSLSKAAARARAIELLELVRIPSPERRYDDYPHKLSGGMRQRAMIAIALACEPQLLIADEPTTALDVTVQAQILYLMGRLREKTGAAIVLITHDLGVVAQVCDEVVVMYAGQVVEQAPVRELFAFPQHPYTVGLLGSLPKFGERKTRLPVIQGSMPNPRNRQRGCRFADRCPFRQSRCDEDQPIFRLSDTRTTRCWRAPLEDLAS